MRREVISTFIKNEQLSRFLDFLKFTKEGEEFGISVEGGKVCLSVPKYPDALKTVIATLHLIGHLVLKHYERGDLFGQDKYWDSACDYSVSNFLYKEILSHFPPSTRKKLTRLLHPFNPLFLNMSTEEIYIHLLRSGKHSRAGDDHSSFSKQPPSLIESFTKEVEREGEFPRFPSAGDAPGYSKKKLQVHPLNIPPALAQYLHSFKSFFLTEDFDVVDLIPLGYGRVMYTTPVITFPHFVFLFDCSESMNSGRWLDSAASIIWSLANYIITHFPKGKITVITADVHPTGMWTGWSNLYNLYTFLSEISGLGGTNILSSLMDVKNLLKPSPTALFVISDYDFDYKLRYPVEDILSFFKSVPLYAAIMPKSALALTPVLHTYYQWKEGDTSYSLNIHALKLLRDEYPKVKVFFEDFRKEA